MLDHKISLGKFKKIESRSNIFSDHSGMKLKINYKKKAKKILKQHAHVQTIVIKDIKGEIKKHLEKNENRNTTFQNLSAEAKVILRGKIIALQAFF